MFGKKKPTIKILGTIPQKSEPEELQNSEEAVAPPAAPLIKIQGKERLAMAPPEQAVTVHQKAESLPKSPSKTLPGIDVKIGKANADGSFAVTASSQFSTRTVQTSFILPFPATFINDVIQDLRGTVQHSGKGNLRIAGNPAETPANAKLLSIEAFGEKVFRSLFNGDLLDMYVESVDSATAQFPICITGGEPANLLPWEFMHDGQRFVCTDVGPIFRIPPKMLDARQEPLPQNLRLLVVATTPVGTTSLGWRQELKIIKELVYSSKIELRVAYSIEEFRKELLEWRPQIIHMIAHGDANALEFGNEDGDSIRVGGVLKNLMATSPEAPRLILFNACDSGGLAADLVRGRIPLAVGMQFAISDAAGQAFARGFYEYARAGLPLHKAAAWGRLTIQTDLGDVSREWATPVVYVNPKTVDLN